MFLTFKYEIKQMFVQISTRSVKLLILIIVITSSLVVVNPAMASQSSANSLRRPPVIIFIQFRNDQSGVQPSTTYICNSFCVLASYNSAHASVLCDSSSGDMEEYAQGWYYDVHGNVIYEYNDADCQMATTTITDSQSGTHYVKTSAELSNINWIITSQNNGGCEYADSTVYFGVIDSGKWEELDQVADYSSNCGSPPSITQNGANIPFTDKTKYGQASQGDQLTAVLEWYVDAYGQYSCVAYYACNFQKAQAMISYLYVSGYS